MNRRSFMGILVGSLFYPKKSTKVSGIDKIQHFTLRCLRCGSKDFELKEMTLDEVTGFCQTVSCINCNLLIRVSDVKTQENLCYRIERLSPVTASELIRMGVLPIQRTLRKRRFS